MAALGTANRTLDELELGAVLFRRFLDPAPNETLELTALGLGVPRVGYAATESEMLELMRAGDALDVHGVYVVANRLSTRYAGARALGVWAAARKRATDAAVAARRVVYIDLDAVREPGTSATERELAPVYEVTDAVEAWLAARLGRSCIGRGFSGNGLSLFIAVEPVTPTARDTAKVRELLECIAARFDRPGTVKIDTRVYNPSRLVPCFGTMKRKGAPSAERPHRRTTFTCRGHVERVPLKELVG